MGARSQLGDLTGDQGHGHQRAGAAGARPQARFRHDTDNRTEGVISVPSTRYADRGQAAIRDAALHDWRPALAARAEATVAAPSNIAPDGMPPSLLSRPGCAGTSALAVALALVAGLAATA
jgi:hypothetical protein